MATYNCRIITRKTRRRKTRSTSLSMPSVSTKPLEDVGGAVTKTLGMKVSRTGKALIGTALVGVGAWWFLSKINIVPPQFQIQNFLPLP